MPAYRNETVDTPLARGLLAWFGGRLYRHQSMRGYLLMMPTLAIMTAAMLLPLLMLVIYSFWTQHYLDINRTFTLQNYAAFLSKPILLELMTKSIKIAAMVTILTVLFAYPMAYFVAFKVKRHKFLWMTILTVPFWTSYLLRVFSWKVVLGYNGVVNSALITLGLVNQPLEVLVYNQAAVVITLVHSWLAFAILPIYVSLEKIDPVLMDASADLGDSPLIQFLRVTLPLSLPGVVASSLLIFIPTAGDYVTPALVGGTEGYMIGNMIDAQFGRLNNWPLGAALSMVLMCLVAMVASVFWWLTAMRMSWRS